MTGRRMEAAGGRNRWVAGSMALVASLALAAGVLSRSAPAKPSRPPAHAARSLPGLLTGFTDEATFQRSPAKRAEALARVKAADGTVIRLIFNWADIAKQEPPTQADARDPQWSGYNWRAPDRIVADVAREGLVPLFTVLEAPRWAEGPGRPRVSVRAPAGSWRPNAEAFGEFAQAVAARYSGNTPDPAHPDRMLPRVRYYQAWNEPNLTNFLTPQWVRSHGRWVAASPGIYRRLLNAFYDGIKAVDPGAVVVAGGTAPYGDYPPPGKLRIPPAQFTRDLLCVRGRAHPVAFHCPEPVKLDALAHHPYPFGSPRRHALNPDDVVIPDFRRLTRPLAVALRAGNVTPRMPKQVWATEISWDSRPPDPGGLPAARQARFLEGALYTLWKQGVDVVTWYLLRDEARGRGYLYTLQSGIYLRGATISKDRRKPSFTAFRFPFTAYRTGRVAELWGLAPGPGTVTIQVRRGHAWRRLTTLHARSDRLFDGHRRLPAKTVLRARWRGQSSLSWRVF